MIIRNDAGSHIFLALLAGSPMTSDRSGLIAKVYQILRRLASLLVEKRMYTIIILTFYPDHLRFK